MSCIICSEKIQSFPKISISIPPFKMLLLEDDPEEAFLLTRTLNQVGKIFWEQSIKSGEKLAENNSFDMALIDLNMVSKYSLEAFEKFHKKFPELPIVILSDSDTVLFAESALNSGALAVINKKHLNDGEYLIKAVTSHLLKAKFIKKAAKLYFLKRKPYLNLIKN